MKYEYEPTEMLDESKVLHGLDVLDVGCGGGLLSEVSSFPNVRVNWCVSDWMLARFVLTARV